MRIYKQTLFISILYLLHIGEIYTQNNPNPNQGLDAFIVNEMAEERLPGASTVIVKDGRIVWLSSYGFADIANEIAVSDTTIFLLASISKVFTATAIMQLMEEGAIDLDENVNGFLPWLLSIPQFPDAPITFRQLMTHTSSIRDNDDVMDTYYDTPDPSMSLAECMQRYFSTGGQDYDSDNNFYSSIPSSRFEYSNIATALNGYLVELISSTPFDEYCEDNIFNTLCMDNTSWFFRGLNPDQVATPYQYSNGNYQAIEHYGFADYPSGQLRSNVLDLANFMTAYLNGGNLGNKSILSMSSINQMWTPQVPSLEPNQGLNWYQEELYHNNSTSLLWGHAGGESGASTDMYLDPLNKIGICVLTNGEGDAIEICDKLYEYALSLDPESGFYPDCMTTSIIERDLPTTERKLVKIIDYLGREVPIRTNTPLIKVFSDGSTERIFILNNP